MQTSPDDGASSAHEVAARPAAATAPAQPAAPGDAAGSQVVPPAGRLRRDVAPSARSDDELLALLLAGERAGGGLARCCRRALERSGGLARVGRMAPRELHRELAALEAVEPGAARRLGAALELGRRALRAELPVGRAVRRAADVEPYLRGQLEGERREVFLVVLLDARHRPFRAERVSEGCLTWAVVHPREVFGPAVREGAGAVIVAHNHPSGDPTPSRQDIEVTARLQRSGELLGVPLLDHIVVGRSRCRSLRAEGHMDADGGAGAAGD